MATTNTPGSSNSKQSGSSAGSSNLGSSSKGVSGSNLSGSDLNSDKSEYSMGKAGASSSADSDFQGSAEGRNARPQTLNDALKILDDALSGDTSKLKEMLSTNYQHVRDAFLDMYPRVSETVRKVQSNISGFSDQGIEKSRQMAQAVDSQVRRNPWPILGGVALGAIAIGYLFGRGSWTSVEGAIGSDFDRSLGESDIH
jgi:ElaB/YqjD/DUF883 family membrane-anchored ribosome-binding protein